MILSGGVCCRGGARGEREWGRGGEGEGRGADTLRFFFFFLSFLFFLSLSPSKTHTQTHTHTHTHTRNETEKTKCPPHLVVLPRLELAAAPRQQQPPDLEEALGQRLKPRARRALGAVDGCERGRGEPLRREQPAPLHAVEGEGEPQGHVDGEVGREGPEGALFFCF